MTELLPKIKLKDYKRNFATKKKYINCS